MTRFPAPARPQEAWDVSLFRQSAGSAFQSELGLAKMGHWLVPKRTQRRTLARFRGALAKVLSETKQVAIGVHD
jgi:hypothetical protein